MKRCHVMRRRWQVFLLSVLFVATIGSTTFAQARSERTGFNERVFEDAQGRHKYQVFIPYNYNQKSNWPVVLFLHGAGERGVDGQRQTQVGLGAFLRSQPSRFPAIAVFPQCEDITGPITEAWQADATDGRRALAILTAVEKEFKTNPAQRVLTGWSMGGFGVWDMAAAMPEFWSAVVPVSGGGNPALAGNLNDLPIWAIHGGVDRVVLPSETERMVAAIQKSGGKIHQTILPESGHDVWKLAYSDANVIRWMLNPQSVDPAKVALGANAQQVTKQLTRKKPFRPAIDISRAVSVRIGNDALRALADSIPRIVSADALSGRVRDIYDTTSAEGRNFRVQFSSINYSGQLVRARLKAHQKNRLNIQLAMSNVSLVIGRTNVTGKRRSAVAGPIRVSLGHRRPLWLSIDVTPYVSGRRIRLRHVGTWFEIPQDNFSVSPPQGVSVDGWGMTSERVSTALVRGIYGKRARLENEMKSVATTIVTQIERYLDFSQTGDVAKAVWPLPVYRPDTRVWASDVATDSQGVSLSFGISADSIRPQSGNQNLQQVTALGPAAAEISQHKKLEVGLSFSLLESLSQLLIDQGIARIHLQDIPGRTFAPLLQRETVEKILPQISDYPKSARVRAELVFTKPIVVSAVDANSQPETELAADTVTEVSATQSSDADPNDDAAEADAPEANDSETIDGEQEASVSSLRLQIPEAHVAYTVQTSADENSWKPLGTFALDISQNVQVEVVQPTYVKRVLQLTWSGEPEILVSDVATNSSGNPACQEYLRKAFANAWSEWAHSFVNGETEVRDIDFGFTRMRLHDAYEDQSQLLVRYTEPIVKIVNRSEEVLVYYTRTPYSTWGGPYELEPGKSHKYGVTTPLLYRRQTNGRYSGYTLPIGSLSVFRTPRTGGAPSLFQAIHEFPDVSQSSNSDGAKNE